MIYPTRLLFWCDAFTVNANLILVKPKHANSSALIAHEKAHQMQMALNGTFTFWRRYLFSRSFRQACEVEAYRVQIAQGAPIITCASHLTRYWLGITQAEAMELLRG